MLFQIVQKVMSSIANEALTKNIGVEIFPKTNKVTKN